MSQRFDTSEDFPTQSEYTANSDVPVLVGVPDIEGPDPSLFHKAIYHPLSADEQPKVSEVDLRDFRNTFEAEMTNKALSTMLLRLAGDKTTYMAHITATDAARTLKAAEVKETKRLETAKKKARVPKAVVDLRKYAATAIHDAVPYRDMSTIVGEYETDFETNFNDPTTGHVDIEKLTDLYPEEPLSHPGLDWLSTYAKDIQSGGKKPERVFRYILQAHETEDYPA